MENLFEDTDFGAPTYLPVPENPQALQQEEQQQQEQGAAEAEAGAPGAEGEAEAAVPEAESSEGRLARLQAEYAEVSAAILEEAQLLAWHRARSGGGGEGAGGWRGVWGLAWLAGMAGGARPALQRQHGLHVCHYLCAWRPPRGLWGANAGGAGAPPSPATLFPGMPCSSLAHRQPLPPLHSRAPAAAAPAAGSEEEMLAAQAAVLTVRAGLIQQLVALDEAFCPPPDYTVRVGLSMGGAMCVAGAWRRRPPVSPPLFMPQGSLA